MSTEHEDDAHDLGLAHDRQFLVGHLSRGMSRRAALGVLAAGTAGAAVLALPARAGASTGTAAKAATTPTPSETNGPYPADGSNGPNVLDDSGVVRRNIRRSFGSSTTKAPGVALALDLRVVHAATSRPYAGAAVYVWHCDAVGRYSLYSSGVTGENFLRGVQVADTRGRLTFLTVFPGCYAGRWPHIHFEVYPTVDDAAAATNRLLTSQIAMPKDACQQVYARSDYPNSATNLSRVSLDTDMVFRDGYAQELATITGSVRHDFTAALTIAI